MQATERKQDQRERNKVHASIPQYSSTRSSV